MAFVLQGYRTLKMPGALPLFKATAAIQTELTSTDPQHCQKGLTNRLGSSFTTR